MRIFKRGEEEEDGVSSSEIEAMRVTVRDALMPNSVEKVALKEIDRIAKMGPSTAEYTIGINYIDLLVSLPWNRMTEDYLDIKTAEAILDEEHFGLPEIKDRILEHLAVRILKASRKHKLLVADDEKVTRMNLEHVLTKEGYQVLTASNGMEALELLEKDSFDVILTDLKMENVDGMGVLREPNK